MPLLNNLERFYIGRNLRDPRKYFMGFSSLFMIAGVIISVAVLSAGLNLFEGYQRTLQKVLLQSLSHIRVTPGNQEYLSESETHSLLTLFRKFPEVDSAVPVINLNVIAHHGNESRICHLKTYGDDQNTSDVWYQEFIKEGDVLPTERGIIIGYYLAKEMKLSLGDTLLLAYPQLNRISAMGMYPGLKEFSVTGIYRSGFYEFDRSLAMVSWKMAQELMLSSEQISGIEVRLHPEYLDQTDRLATEWEMNLGLWYLFIPWTYDYSGLFRLIEVEKWLVAVIFSFLVLIAGINIISAAQTVMLDKRNEIAILKTIGANRLSLRRLFFMRIGVACTLSIVIGQVIGVAVSYLIVKQNLYHLKGEVYFIDQITMHVSLVNQIIVFSVAVIVMLLCILIPLKRMDKMQILEIFRTA